MLAIKDRQRIPPYLREECILNVHKSKLRDQTAYPFWFFAQQFFHESFRNCFISARKKDSRTTVLGGDDSKEEFLHNRIVIMQHLEFISLKLRFGDTAPVLAMLRGPLKLTTTQSQPE